MINEGKDVALKSDETMPPMIRVLGLGVVAILIGLIELLVFSAVAFYCGVKVDLITMTLVWKIAFVSLFIIPGLLLFFALMVLSSMFND